MLPSSAWISNLPRLEQRKYRYAKLLEEANSGVAKSKVCSLLSLVSPAQFKADSSGSHLASIKFQRNQYLDKSKAYDLNAQVESTAETFDVDASQAFRSIGYKASPLPGLGRALGIDFDSSRGVMQNDGLGRALSVANVPGDLDPSVAQRIIRGCYCSGWIKTGPTGVIASTMSDAFTTADALLRDWDADVDFLNGSRRLRAHGELGGWESLQNHVNLKQPVSWQGWKAIDKIETAQGLLKGGRPRIKMTDIDRMLSAASTA